MYDFCTKLLHMSEKSCTFAPDFENRSPWRLKTDITMTRKRRQENLAYLLEIEQEMLRDGKRLSKAFYAVKSDLQKSLITTLPIMSL